MEWWNGFVSLAATLYLFPITVFSIAAMVAIGIIGCETKEAIPKDTGKENVNAASEAAQSTSPEKKKDRTTSKPQLDEKTASAETKAVKPASTEKKKDKAPAEPQPAEEIVSAEPTRQAPVEEVNNGITNEPQPAGEIAGAEPIQEPIRQATVEEPYNGAAEEPLQNQVDAAGEASGNAENEVAQNSVISEVPPYIPDTMPMEEIGMDEATQNALDQMGLLTENGEFDFEAFGELPTL